MSFRCVVNSTKIKPIFVQTQLNSIYVIELHVSTSCQAIFRFKIGLKT